MADRCKSCGAGIEWAFTEKGRRIPIDPGVAPGGNLVVEREPGRQVQYAHPTALGEGNRISHFATCPNAKKHRRKR